MKQILTIASLAFLSLAACTKVNTETPKVESEQEVNFQTAIYAGQTKAGSTNFDTDQTFGTYAWFNGTAPFMVNQEISYQTNVWKAEGQTYYWPKTGSLDFVAYYPYNANSPWLTVETTTLTASTEGLATDADYLYSDKAVGYTSNGTNGVPIIFRHALAQVCVKVKAAKLFNGNTEEASDVKWDIQLLGDGSITPTGAAQVTTHAPKISGVATKGSLSMNLASSNTGTTNLWTLPTNSVWAASDFDQEIECSALTLTTEPQDILALSTVMPQSLGNQNLHLEFAITTTNKNASTAITEYFTTTINLKEGMGDQAPQHWQMNKQITYTVTLDPAGNEIIFDPSVVEWETVNGAHTYQPYQ